MSDLYIRRLCNSPDFLHGNSQPDLLNKLVNIHADTQNNLHSRDEMRNILKELELDSLLIEYLVDHGALTCDDASKLLRNDDTIEEPSKIDLLLDCLDFFDSTESSNPNHKIKLSNLVLLVNALRNTGQHELASQLDCSRRIIPSKVPSLLVNDSGYFNESYDPGSKAELNTFTRRRGQLKLWLQVSAVMVNKADYEFLLPDFGEKVTTRSGRIQLNKGRAVDHGLTGQTEQHATGDEDDVGPLKQFLRTQHGTSFWIDLDSIQPVVVSSIMSSLDKGVHRESKSDIKFSNQLTHRLRRFFFCCCRQSQKGKPVTSSRLYFSPVAPQNLIDYRLPSFVLPLSNGYVDQKPKNIARRNVDAKALEKQEHLRSAKLSILDKKSSQFYSRLMDPNSVSHDKLVKFLEQNCGVLVLGFHVENSTTDERSTFLSSTFIPAIAIKPVAAISISVVATTLEAVRKLLSSVIVEPAFSTEIDDFNSSTPMPISCLSKDLQNLLLDAIVTEYHDTNVIRLSVALNTEEIRLALNELSA